jgi:tetratricopeptide (TPR) repeat protein
MLFDIALSFAGEDRPMAQRLAQALGAHGLVVFFDDDQQADLLGENLTEYLAEIYKNRSRFCVVLVSTHYVKKRWTRHEWRAAQARAFENYDEAYILPVRLDGTELPGLLPTTGFLELDVNSNESFERIVSVIATKAHPTSELRKVVTQARSAFRQGDLGRVCSLLTLERLKKEIENDRDSLRLLADTQLMRGNHLDAFPNYQLVTQKFPSDVDAWFQAGVCLVRAGELEKSIVFFKQTLHLAPGHTTAQAELERISKQRWLEKLPLVGKIYQSMSSYSRRSKKVAS